MCIIHSRVLWIKTPTAGVSVTPVWMLAAQSLKMIGLLLASYRTDSISCSLNTCAFTAAHACTSPQPTYTMCVLPTALRGSKGSNPSQEVEW